MRDERSLLTDEILLPINLDNIVTQSDTRSARKRERASVQLFGTNQRNFDYSAPAVLEELMSRTKESRSQEAPDSKASQHTVKHLIDHSQMENDLKMPKRARKTSPAMEPYAGQHNIELTEKQIAAAIPENASAVFHVMDRRVNIDQHSSNPSMYSLLRSWVQDDPYRRIPPPGLCCMAQTPPSGTSLHEEKKKMPPHSNDTASTDESTDFQSNGETAGGSTDMLSIIIKKDHPTAPCRHFMFIDLISRARKARSRDRKSVVARATATKLALQRKGIVLPPKCI
jgi:hypothetical protein